MVPASLEGIGPYILGLDIGTRSIGWSLIGIHDKKPNRVVRAGVRCFEAGVEGDIQAGKDASRAAARREKRLARRQHWRRSWRRAKLFRVLQHLGFLPPGGAATPEERHSILLKLDADLRRKHLLSDDHLGQQVLPYRIRARAADEPVDPFEFGRALFHLGHRRGYLSNRKADADRDEESGVVHAGISELEKELGELTLGQYFGSLNPEKTRVRRRWTSRQMYLSEFEKIWETQRHHHSILQNDGDGRIKKIVWKTIFFQRPLKSQKGLVGLCELEPGKRRGQIAYPIAQEFRILQAVNHLTVVTAHGQRMPLDAAQKNALTAALQDVGEMTYGGVRKLLQLPRNSHFTIEEGGEKRIIGNRTRSALRTAFGARWDSLPRPQQEQIIGEVLNYRKRDALIRRAERAWGLDRPAAEMIADVSLETGYSRHSKAALEKLVPFLRGGLTYSESRKAAYPQSFTTVEPYRLLPPVLKARPDLRNPAVARALTELRKVVNALVRRYGKPELFRIELARDLKRSRDERKRLSDRIRENERKREKATRKILDELGDPSPRRGDVEKVLLAEECCWRCPYTGRQIDMRSLIGPSSQFDVEHIFPRRFLDDSFANKTLCYHEENRERKRDNLPFDAYAADAQRWNEIVDRVRRFEGPAANEKLRRFLIEVVPADFVSRQLNDTRYNSSLAADYVGMLYGGRWDAAGTLRVHTLTGGITGHLRNEWLLNGILGDGTHKSRDDHRHHAVDATVIALCDSGTVEILQSAAEEASRRGSRRMFASVAEPWSGFIGDVRQAIQAINVSHRVNRKLAGPLHAESLYSKAQKGEAGGEVRHIRKQLHKLSVSEINGEQIVDPAVRRLVQEKYNGLGQGRPDKVFSDPANHPAFVTADGRTIPVHKVRLRARPTTQTVGSNSNARYVAAAPGSNHHTAIVAILNSAAEETRWVDEPCSRLEVYKRLKNKELVVRLGEGTTRRLKYVLIPNDSLLLDDDAGGRQLFRVANIAKNDIELRLHNDARESTVLRKGKQRTRMSGDSLRKRRAVKVEISPIGDIILPKAKTE